MLKTWMIAKISVFLLNIIHLPLHYHLWCPGRTQRVSLYSSVQRCIVSLCMLTVRSLHSDWWWGRQQHLSWNNNNCYSKADTTLDSANIVLIKIRLDRQRFLRIEVKFLPIQLIICHSSQFNKFLGNLCLKALNFFTFIIHLIIASCLFLYLLFISYLIVFTVTPSFHIANVHPPTESKMSLKIGFLCNVLTAP